MNLWSALKFVIIALVSVVGLVGCASMSDGPKRQLAIQVSDNDPAKWNLALNVAKNVQKDLGKENTEVEIVAFGPGLNMLKMESVVANRLKAASHDGVQLRACANTMKAMKLSDKDLFADAKVVPAGVIELMDKQEAGWTIVRP